jgi:hypothetical protein
MDFQWIRMALIAETSHGLWAVLWCSPLLVGLWLISITRLRGYLESIMDDSFTRILLLLAIGLFVLGLSLQSHVYADWHSLGF